MQTAMNFDYALLDSGSGRKLERFGPLVVDRPEPTAIWAPALHASRWLELASASYHEILRHWVKHSMPALPWNCASPFGDLQLDLLGGGQVGIFPEQYPNWLWLRDAALSCSSPEVKLVNCFGYTGASTLAVAASGCACSILHVDASAAALNLARGNIPAHSQQAVSFLKEDVLTFLHRLTKRGNALHGLVADPPSFGRAPEGKATWSFKRDLPALLDLSAGLLASQGRFMLLTWHTTGFPPEEMLRLVARYPLFSRQGGGNLELLSMELHDPQGRRLPRGHALRWHK